MVSPSNIVTGSIVANVNSLQLPGFGIPLVLGSSSSTIDKGSFNIFTNMIGVSEVFSDSDPEWIQANAIFSQNPTVQQIFIGRELDRVAQHSTIVFSADIGVGARQSQDIVFAANLITGNTYHLTINGGSPIAVPFDSTNDNTVSEIAAAINTFLDGDGTATQFGSHTITLVATNVGISIALTASSVTGGASQTTTTITQTIAPVAADVINGKVNGVSISPVTAAISNANTLGLIDDAISAASDGSVNASDDASHTITCTPDTPGIPFTLTDWVVTGPSAPTVVVTVTVANVGLNASLNSIANVNNQFYALIWCESNPIFVENAFSVIEASPYFYMTTSDDAGILDPASTTDIAYLCKAGNYARSAVWYSGTDDTLAAAVFGKNLPNPPGKVNWAFTQLNGITADNLTQSQYAAALGKNCNVFVPYANVDMTFKGTCGNGLYIDYRIGIDWTNTAMVTALFNTIAQLITGQKVPYTDAGVATLEAAMYGVLEQGAQNQFIVGGIKSAQNPFGYSVGALPVAQIQLQDVANRYYPALTFEATFVGAIDSCTYAGTISLP